VAKKAARHKNFVLYGFLLGVMVLIGGGGCCWWYFNIAGAASSNNRIKQEQSNNDMAGEGEDSEITASQAILTDVACIPPDTTVYNQPLSHDNTILLSTTIPKTGELGLLGRALSDGVFLSLNKINTLEGGVWEKHRLSLDQRDDNGKISHALPLVYDLLKKSALFFSVAGEVVFEKVYLPLLSTGSLAALFPAVGMRAGITASMPVLWYRPPYSQEIAALLDYSIRQLKLNQIAVFYEESSWGIEAKNSTEYLLRTKYNLPLHAAASYQPGTVTIQAAVAELKKSGPQVILCLANGRPTYNFIREAINQQLHYAAFLGLSRVASIAPQLKTSRGIELITASVVPSPHKSQLAIVQEYRRFMQQYLPNKGLSSDTLEGYIAATLLAYFINQLPPTATVGDLLTAIAQTETIIFKGLTLTYKEKTLSWSVWLNKGIDVDWQEYREET